MHLRLNKILTKKLNNKVINYEKKIYTDTSFSLFLYLTC